MTASADYPPFQTDTCDASSPNPSIHGVRSVHIPITADVTYHSDISLSTDERHQAYSREYNAWVSEKAFIRVDRSSVGEGSNIIGSHTIFSRKDDGTAKARIVPWGHRDADRDSLRNDSPCANLEIFRLVLSVAAEHRWVLGQMDVSTAFLQAEGFHREIYVKPPKEAVDPTGLWKLQAAAYGLVDSGRLWYRTSDHALVTEYKLTRSCYEPKLYYKLFDEKLAFILVTQVDNYIYSGSETEVSSFEKFLQSRFNVGTLDRNQFRVLGCELEQQVNGTVVLSQKTRLNEIDEKTLTLPPTDLDRSPDRCATPKEIRAYRSILGKMLYVGRMSQPIMLYHASHMASKLNTLKLHHLKDLGSLLRFDKKNVPILRFLPPSTKGGFSLLAISDASMSNAADGGARGAFILVRRHGDIAHPIFWCARKLR